MMIDFALAAEREQGLSPYDAIYQGVSSAFPPDPDDHHGCALFGAVPLMLSTGLVPSCASRWGLYGRY